MAFPVVQAEASSQEPTNTATHTVSLPTGIVSGDLLIVFFCVDGTASTAGWPAGWTEIVAEVGTGFTTSVRFRKADGTEGASITVTTTGDVEQSSHASYRISGYFDSATTADFLAATTTTTGTTGNPDPPSLDPANWATEDTLWIAFCGLNGASSTEPRVTGYPTSYTNGVESRSAGGNGCVLGVARRENAVASEDPGTFTISGAPANWNAVTLAVRPATAVTVTMDMWNPLPNQPYPDAYGVVGY